MLKQYQFRVGNLRGFLDQQSKNCRDGRSCDTNGCLVYGIDGKRVYERDFKKYRKFSPQYRQAMIMEDLQNENRSLTAISCSCSKCGTVKIDESIWE
jgi:hypothetical protein